MPRVEKKLTLSDETFKRRIGTTKPVFQTMLVILQEAYSKLHESGGKPPSLTVGDKLLLTLKYYREYTTMESIADDYHLLQKHYLSLHDLGRRHAFCRWSLSVAGQKSPSRGRDDQDGGRGCDGASYRTSPKKQEDWYSGKKKCHTIKSQMIADAETRLIYDVEESPGSVHDFKLCKETLLCLLILWVMILADSGYQGIRDYHEWSLIPRSRRARRRNYRRWKRRTIRDYRGKGFLLRTSMPR